MSNQDKTIDYYKKHVNAQDYKQEKSVTPDNENDNRPYQLVRSGSHPPSVRVVKSHNSQKIFPLALITDVDWENGVITIKDSRKSAVISGRNLYPLFTALTQYKVMSIQTSPITEIESRDGEYIEDITFLKNED